MTEKREGAERSDSRTQLDIGDVKNIFQQSEVELHRRGWDGSQVDVEIRHGTNLDHSVLPACSQDEAMAM